MRPVFEILVPLFLLIAVALIVWRSVRIVPQGYNYTTERFGKYMRTLTPGLHILTPLIERVGHKVNMMEQVIDVPRQDVITKDNALVNVDGVAFFQVLNAARASYEITQLQQSMIFLTLTNIRTVMGSMDLDDLLSNRDRINARLLQTVDAATEPWGVKVTRIEIKDIAPPKDIVESMGRQLKAERDKRALILESEGLRQGAILKAEGEKQAVVLAAEGRKEAAFRDAEARERLAQAEAEATRMVSAAVSTGSAQALNYFVANNYVDALKALATSSNQKILMMPLDASSVIGSLAGLAQITGDAFGSGNAGAAPNILKPNTPPAPQTPTMATSSQNPWVAAPPATPPTNPPTTPPTTSRV
jgi:regulator of protease activity HflC (stomatin/prohibitin superfamily)